MVQEQHSLHFSRHKKKDTRKNSATERKKKKSVHNLRRKNGNKLLHVALVWRFFLSSFQHGTDEQKQQEIGI